MKTDIFWKNKNVLVTGGAGFLGSHVVDLLKKKNPKSIRIPRSKEFDLRLKENCAAVVKDMDVVLHLAALVGGIGLNRQIPGQMFYDNILMGTYMIDEAYKAGVKKFVALGTICAYPKFTPTPFKEDELWHGYPEETNAPHGLAKKMMLVQAQAYRQQYGFNCVYLLPVNLYGPRDNFGLETSHVIPALIQKFVEAKMRHQKQVTVWGTGMATREFLYAPDAAEGILLAAERYNKPDPVNLGSGFEISIKDLVALIADLTGFKGKIVWDIGKPDGQPKRKLDTSRAENEFGFKAKTDFRKGLQASIHWYLANRQKS